MKIALIGATGNIGAKILNEALERAHKVTGIVRNLDKLKGRNGLTAKQCDLADEKKLADLVKGHSAVIVSVRHDLNDVRHVYAACRSAGVRRVLVVGGAASLEVAPGVMLIDTPGFPDQIKVQATPAVEALNHIRMETDLEWSFVSPSIMIAPGERTGKFRIGADELLKDAKGESRISQEDFAIAIIDEVEKPKHIRKRFTVGY
ncbi:MAG: NAD(P)-dependent oxidoreductase [Gammaproteobacteria bacterium]|nr:NAD(P)-dependent oxidoreductase [Gammaproteobacteria bacterium]